MLNLSRPPKPPRAEKYAIPTPSSESWDQPSTSGLGRSDFDFSWETDSVPDEPVLLDEDEYNMLHLQLIEEYIDALPDAERVLFEDLDLVQSLRSDFRIDPMLSDILQKRKATDAIGAFNHGNPMTLDCEICFDEKKLYRRQCCQSAVCDDCLKQYLETQINEGELHISCLGSDCSMSMFREEILARVSVKVKEKYYRFLVDVNKDPKVKTCPKCSFIHTITDEELEQKNKYGLLVACPEKTCHQKWCFICHAPWHLGIKCSDYVKGDKLVAEWAKEKHYGNTNAQKCPKCKVGRNRGSHESLDTAYLNPVNLN